MFRKSLFLFLFFLVNFSFAQLNHDTFNEPSNEYGIRCWWWWLNGNVTKASITRDLEEMKVKGFSGACIFDAGGANQLGNAQVPAGPLWGSSEWKTLYLHTIDEAERLGLVMSLNIQSGWNLGGPDVEPHEAAKQITFSEIQIKGRKNRTVHLPIPEIRDEFYEDIAVLAYPTRNSTAERLPLQEFDNKSARKEVGWSAPETRPLLKGLPNKKGEEDAAIESVINLNSHFKDGILNWKAPKGEWTILRIGYTTTDAEVSTSSAEWNGRVLDYMSITAFERYWDTHVAPLLSMIGSRAGSTLKYLQTDSFEAGGMNWTDGFENEFKNRRGYKITKYLPVLAGKIIGSREESTNFLNDFRKTIGDLVSDHHYRIFAEKSAAYGIGIQPESAGPHAGPLDGLKNYGHSEIMMSEFWSPSDHRSKPIDRFFVKQAASAAKIFNKKLVGAESFTTIGPHWNDVLWKSMKSAADHEFCAGLNLVYLSTFTNSPQEMGMPGQEYFAGTHFNPNVTWWDDSVGFIDYLKRIQYLMQEGRSHADVLYYYGDHVPNIGRFKEDDPAGVLSEYDYDLINEDKLLELEVADTNLTLSFDQNDSIHYKLLVLPDHEILSLAVLQKLEKLVKAGAAIQGSKPKSMASLVGGTNAVLEFKRITDLLWGKRLGTVQHTGSGNVFWYKKTETKKTLKLLDVKPDLIIDDNPKKIDGGWSFDYIRRIKDSIDYYFISNQKDTKASSVFTFPISNRQPELWNPLTGVIKDLHQFKINENGMRIELKFNPFESYFIVFQKPIDEKTISTRAKDFPVVQTVKGLTGSWNVSFDQEWGGPKNIVFDSLLDWSKHPSEGIKYYSGTAVYRKTFLVDKGVKYLELGDIKDVGVARIKLNGNDLGVVWTPPFRIDISEALIIGENKLEIHVTNSWRNRLIGDRNKPIKEKLTNTNIRVGQDWKLEASGLLGPVFLMN